MDRELATWAARMIREQDEVCRSQIPAYGSFSQEEMRNLKALEALASGKEPDPRDYVSELEEVEAQLEEAFDVISQIYRALNRLGRGAND